MQEPLTFVVATNNRKTLEGNFLASPCLREPHPHQILIQEGFRSAAKAYNEAISRSVNDLIVFIHQDVFLPQPWLSQLRVALECLAAKDPRWGVLGCFGSTRDEGSRGHVYSSGLGILGRPFKEPEPVQTLDEIVLVVRRSSGLQFDESIPHFHMYGADICMTAASRGMKSYAIPAFCIHNTQQILVLPKDFYECYRRVRRKWKKSLPIQTTCIRVTRSILSMYARRLHEFGFQVIRRPEANAAAREENVNHLIRTIESAQPKPSEYLGRRIG